MNFSWTKRISVGFFWKVFFAHFPRLRESYTNYEDVTGIKYSKSLKRDITKNMWSDNSKEWEENKLPLPWISPPSSCSHSHSFTPLFFGKNLLQACYGEDGTFIRQNF
jgi:hypothetical protein